MRAAHGTGRFTPWGVVFMVGLVLTACDSSEAPSGPGTVTARVSAPVPLAAAVIQIVGPGISGARTLDAGLISGAPTGDSLTPGYRVVIFNDSPGPLRVSLEVEDVESEFTASVLEAADADGQPVAGVGGLIVNVAR